MSLDYTDLLRRAWRIIWNNKILWVFGILAGLGGGGRASFNFSGGGGGGPSGPGGGPGGDLPPALERFFEGIDPNWVIALVIGIACVILLIALVLFIVSVIGTGGLIGGVQLADRQGRVTFGEAWAVGVRHFWTVLLIGLIVGILGFLLALSSLFAFLTVCLAPLACVGFLVVAVLGIYTHLAQIAAVTEGLGVTEALSRAWGVIRANLGAVIILALILIVITALAGFLLSLPILALLAPVLLAVVGFATDSAAIGTTGLAIAGLCFLIYIPVLIVLNGILQAWYTAAWTLAYQQLSGRPAVAPYAGPAPA